MAQHLIARCSLGLLYNQSIVKDGILHACKKPNEHLGRVKQYMHPLVQVVGSKDFCTHLVIAL